MSESAQPSQQDLRHESFFRESSETSAPKPVQTREFPHIPRLGPAIYNDEVGSVGIRGVLLHEGGVSGALYAQVPIEFQKVYTDAGWWMVRGRDGQLLPTYTILAKDEDHEDVDCILLGAGKEIHGMDNKSNLRDSRIHDDIPLRTGHENERWPEIEAVLGPIEPPAEPKQKTRGRRAKPSKAAPDDGFPVIGAAPKG